MVTKSFITAFLAIFSLVPCYGQKHQHGKASYYSKEQQVPVLQAAREYIMTV